MGRVTGIALGVLVGGLVGALARPTVVYAYWLRSADADLSWAVVTFSAGIGLIVGIVAVLIAALFRGPYAGPLAGAIIGAALAYLVTALTFLPLMFGGLLGVNGIRVVDDNAPLYGIAMALTGAVSGGGGAAVVTAGRRASAASDGHRGYPPPR
jgi:hypothetical protein